jgi:hypothetical protein
MEIGGAANAKLWIVVARATLTTMSGRNSVTQRRTKIRWTPQRRLSCPQQHWRLKHMTSGDLDLAIGVPRQEF